MVGQETVDGDEVAKVYYLSGDRTSVTSEVLTGLPDFPQTIVSVDISRMVAVSAGHSSNAILEVLVPSKVLFWDSSAPESAIRVSALCCSDLPELVKPWCFQRMELLVSTAVIS